MGFITTSSLSSSSLLTNSHLSLSHQGTIPRTQLLVTSTSVVSIRFINTYITVLELFATNSCVLAHSLSLVPISTSEANSSLPEHKKKKKKNDRFQIAEHGLSEIVIDAQPVRN